MARKNPTEKTLKQLFALSGNHCAFPDCNQRLVDENGNLVAQICHIEAAKPGGERYNPNQSDDERASFNNLIVLCANHHIVTNDVITYTVDVLRDIKAKHEAKFINESYKVPSNILEKLISTESAIGKVEDQNTEILEILKSGKFQVQPREEELLPGIANALRKAEVENTGLKFIVSMDSSGIANIEVASTPEANGLNIAKVIFPDTEVGRRGRQRFISAMEKGESLQLEPDECEWELNIKIPIITALPFQYGALRLSRNLPDLNIPVRLGVTEI